MAGNNVSAEGIEALRGVRTYSQTEMALNPAALLHPTMTRLAWECPLWTDFMGRFHAMNDIKAATVKVSGELEAKARVAKTLAASAASDSAVLSLRMREVGEMQRQVGQQRLQLGPSCCCYCCCCLPTPVLLSPV